MQLDHLSIQSLDPTPAGADPFTLFYGGYVLGVDGKPGVADVVLSADLITEIGTCVCLPANSEVVDARGSLVRERGTDAVLEPGRVVDLVLEELAPVRTPGTTWQPEVAA